MIGIDQETAGKYKEEFLCHTTLTDGSQAVQSPYCKIRQTAIKEERYRTAIGFSKAYFEHNVNHPCISSVIEYAQLTKYIEESGWGFMIIKATS